MDSNKFLFDNLYSEFGRVNIHQREIDEVILGNLNPKFKLRYYQEQAFQMFETFFEEDHPFKHKPISLLFYMATGSGKTLIMAGLILYLYKKGYSNFLFFVDKTEIIEKTKDNFLNKSSQKYLFNNTIKIDNKVVNINVVNNFEGVNPEDINICFTTIHKLHNDLTTERENLLTLDEFKNKDIVFISDESHHIQTKTKRQKEQQKLSSEPSWENTIERVFNINDNNILLEFTATPGFEKNENVKKKYLSRLIYRYDLKQFVQDKYSKNIDIFRVDDDNIENIMLLSVLINQYRQDIANKHGINLKPVILFKATKEIKDSNENEIIFNTLISNLTADKIKKFKVKYSDDPVLNKVFDFYENEGFSLSNLANKLKINFDKSNCFNGNEKNIDDKRLSNKDKDYLINQQSVLNNLEDEDNNIRVVFAVNKLNEGWDVLNLFDIVRIPSKKSQKTSSKKNKKIKPTKSTISEAQLIGRGARYYPFVLNDDTEKFIRKFDDDVDNDLKILEDLFYYSYNEPKYIIELKQALRDEGLSLAEDAVHKELKLKDEFKSTDFYKSGKIYLNERIAGDYAYVDSFKDLNDDIKNYHYELHSGDIELVEALSENDIDVINKSSKLVSLNKIQPHVIRNALSKIDFYKLDNLQKYFDISSIDDLISGENFLRDFSITFHGTKETLEDLSNTDLFNGVYNLLLTIEKEVSRKIVHYKGSLEFKENNIKDIFHDKELMIPKRDMERLDGQEYIIKDCKWYVFNANYGTSEEKACFEFIKSIMGQMENKFKQIYLIRNERHFKIYNFDDGNAFEPDFVLFLKDDSGRIFNYQLFIEPKGDHLLDKDSWKEEFLSNIDTEITDSKLTENEEYRIYGLPFYNVNYESEFKKELFKILDLN